METRRPLPDVFIVAEIETIDLVEDEDVDFEIVKIINCRPEVEVIHYERAAENLMQNPKLPAHQHGVNDGNVYDPYPDVADKEVEIVEVVDHSLLPDLMQNVHSTGSFLQNPILPMFESSVHSRNFINPDQDLPVSGDEEVQIVKIFNWRLLPEIMQNEQSSLQNPTLQMHRPSVNDSNFIPNRDAAASVDEEVQIVKIVNRSLAPGMMLNEHSAESSLQNPNLGMYRPSVFGSNFYNPNRDLAPKTGLRPIIIDGNSVALSHGGYSYGGYSQGGYNNGGYNNGGYNNGGYNNGGYNNGGYNNGGYNNGGYNNGDFNNGGYSQGGYNNCGFNNGGYNNGGYSQGGYNNCGFNNGGYNNGGYSQGGYNNCGFNNGGYSQGGYNYGDFNNGAYSQGGDNNGGYSQGGYNNCGYNNGGYSQGGYSHQGYGQDYGQVFSSLGIKICVDYFLARGHKVACLVPLYRRSDAATTDRYLLDKLQRQGNLSYTPSRYVGMAVLAPECIRYIVQIAAELGGIIITQDDYRQIEDASHALRDVIGTRILSYRWAGDELKFPARPFGRRGVTLDQMLRF